MFGYIRVQSSELKVKEYEFYRGTYCGLCRAMGHCTGQCSRMTLSYDFVFLALVRLALTGDDVSFSQKRCLAHPLKKRNSMKQNPVLEYCAGAAAILNYHKLRDDLSDEKGFKKFRARLALPAVSHARKKALKSGLSDLDSAVRAGLCRLAETEEEKIASVDRPAALFGDILGDIMSFGLEGSDARIAASVGRTVGAWIYMADALDDLEEDAEKGRYNPFLLLWGRIPTEAEKLGISDALKNELYAAENAADLIPFENESVQNIVQNILLVGMPERIRQIICKKEDEKSKKKEKGHHKE